jgi:hypothetical protein
MAIKTWAGAAAGTWGNGANWSPGGLPAATDDVALYGAAQISGSGVSSSITVYWSVILSGAYATGLLNIGSPSTTGSLTLSSGNLAATSANIMFGPLAVTGPGTKLTVTGQLTMGGSRTGTTALTANTLLAGSGGVVQVGNVVMSATPGGNGLLVDGVSSIEVGALGGAALGKITVDANRSITGLGSLTAPNGVVNNGTITAQGGALSIGVGVTGSGQLQIAAGSTLYLMSGATSQPVTFTGANGTLEFVANGSAGLTETGTISGFLPGDRLWFASGANVTGVTYTAGTGNIGTLALKNGGVTVGSLTLAGNYAGYAFQVSQDAGFGWDIAVAKLTSGTAFAGSPGTDAFGWVGSSGSWNTATSWQDTTTLVNGVAVPGANNAVVLNGPSGNATQTITGPGQAATLTTKGNTTLSGSFSAGSLTVGSGTTASQLLLQPGSTLSTGAASVANGGITVSGTTFAAGFLTLGGAASAKASNSSPESLNAKSASTVQLGGLTLGASPGGSAVTVDSSSVVEIGTAGGAGAGTITIDPGRVVLGSGLMSASNGVSNQGVIVAAGGALNIGAPVTGSGTLAISDGATLFLYGGVSTQPVRFAGVQGTLEMTLASGALTSSGPISGFAPGDTIFVASSTNVTGAIYSAGANGTGQLMLYNGTTPMGALTLNGDFSYEYFKVAPHGSYGSDITVVPTFSSPDPLFDPVFYLRQNPDVAASGLDPYQHYLDWGWKEGRDPNANFHTTYYLNQNPDVKAQGVNPLLHFELFGWKEGRDPSLGFSLSGYLAANPDVKAAGFDPLLHYMIAGQAEGRATAAAAPHAVGTPDVDIDYAYYYAQHPDVAASGLDASVHYHTIGYKLGYNPNPFFDTNFYLTQNPDVRDSNSDPLLHYELYGWKEGRAPSLLFSTSSYLAANADVAHQKVDPLLHYLLFGQFEGRAGVLSGQGTAPDPLIDSAYVAKQAGASLVPPGTAGQSALTAFYGTIGWREGLNPDAWFDTSYYLSHNPDVAKQGVNALLHYELYGWKEGRDPSAQFSTNKYLAAYSDVRAANVDPLVDFMTVGQAAGRQAIHV